VEISSNLLPPATSSKDFHPNDGIVNTVSMRGPDDHYVKSVVNFPVQKLASKTQAASARGVYWHLGINKTMDHGDQIGVFTVGETVSALWLYSIFYHKTLVFHSVHGAQFTLLLPIFLSLLYLTDSNQFSMKRSNICIACLENCLQICLSVPGTERNPNDRQKLSLT